MRFVDAAMVGVQSMNKKIIASSTALIFGAIGSATAARAQTPYDNLEFYLGAHGGVLFGDGELYDDVGGIFDTSNATLGLLGVLGGMNIRNEYWFFGVEADVGFALDSSIPSGPCGGVDLCDITTTGHVRGRVGYMLGNVDLFVAGGLALAHAEMNVLSASHTKTLTGVTIGAGADIAVSDKLKARVEVLHDDYGDKEFAPGYGVKNWSDNTVRAAAIFTF